MTRLGKWVMFDAIATPQELHCATAITISYGSPKFMLRGQNRGVGCCFAVGCARFWFVAVSRFFLPRSNSNVCIRKQRVHK